MVCSVGGSATEGFNSVRTCWKAFSFKTLSDGFVKKKTAPTSVRIIASEMARFIFFRVKIMPKL